MNGIKAELYFQLPIMAFALAYVLAAVVVAFWLGQEVGEGFFSMATTIGTNYKFIAITIVLYVLARQVFVPEGQKKGVRAILVALGTYLSPRNIISRLLPITVSILAMNVAFSFFKRNITTFVPFSWDRAFADLDEILFFGTPPWELTHALFPGSMAAFLISVLYGVWFFLMFGVWLIEALRPANDPVRLRFFLSFLLITMIGGSLMATIFSSAGPCFYDDLIGGDRFAPLMDTLRTYNFDHSLAPLRLQELLWATYIGTPGANLHSISAFPSFHILVVVLYCFLAAARGPVYLALMVIFTIAIFIGSIHLGWHYAVDGIASGFLAWGCWWLGGVLTNRWIAWNARRNLALQPA